MEREDEGDTVRIGAKKKASHQKDALKKRLMFVDTVIESKPTKSTMVHSGATHNFLFEQRARRLELKIKKDTSKMKVVNSESLPIFGVLKRISPKLGEWGGDVDLVMVCMDDFEQESDSIEQ